jgi:hypothetical protein
MNALVLTLLSVAGADGYAGGECAACGQHGGLHHGRAIPGGLHGWCGPMPQSCYDPSFGCYPSTRYMHRYPAFHNTYYRSAYNYRQYFDYPWHAGMHEPTSMYSYNVGQHPGAVETVPTPEPTAQGGAVGAGVRR